MSDAFVMHPKRAARIAAYRANTQRIARLRKRAAETAELRKTPEYQEAMRLLHGGD